MPHSDPRSTSKCRNSQKSQGLFRSKLTLSPASFTKFCTYRLSQGQIQEFGLARAGWMASAFYRAKLRVARYCHSKLSVRPSVCLSVCDVEVSWSYRLEFCENNFTASPWCGCLYDEIKIYISLTSSLFADPNVTDLLQREGNTPNFSRNGSGVGKIVDFRHLIRRISETVQDRVQVAIDL